MFWEDGTGEEVASELKSLVEQDLFDDVIIHPLCFQEIRQNSDYLLNYLSTPENTKKLLENSIFRVPPQDVDPVDQFKNSPYSIAILSMGSPILFYSLRSNFDLWSSICDYLKDSDSKPFVNHVTVGFYKRLMLSLLVATMEGDLLLFDDLAESGFFESLVKNLRFGAIAELLVRFPIQGAGEGMQRMIFKKYAEHKIPLRLMQLLTPDVSDDVLENLVFVFSELDEMQLRSSFTAQEFADQLFSEEALHILLESAFPEDSTFFRPKITSVACGVLMMYFDLNHSVNEPAFKINPELYMRVPTDEVYSEGYELETLIAKKSEQIIKYLLYCFEEDDEDVLLTAVNCISVLQGLVNSSYLPTHKHLKEVMSKKETSWRSLIDGIRAHPSATVLTTRIVNLFGYMLYSNPISESFPLVDMLLFCQEGLCEIITVKVNSFRPKEQLTFEQRTELAAYIQLGLHLKKSQEGDTVRSRYIEMLVNDSESASRWNDLSNTTLMSYAENSRSANMMTPDRSVVVDELEDSRDHEEISSVDLNSMDRVLHPFRVEGFNANDQYDEDLEVYPTSCFVNLKLNDTREEGPTKHVPTGHEHKIEFEKNPSNSVTVKNIEEQKENDKEVEELIQDLMHEPKEEIDEAGEWGDDPPVADDFPPLCNTPHAKDNVHENQTENKTEKFESPDTVLERLDSEKRTPRSSRLNVNFSSPPADNYDPSLSASDTPKTTRKAAFQELLFSNHAEGSSSIDSHSSEKSEGASVDMCIDKDAQTGHTKIFTKCNDGDGDWPTASASSNAASDQTDWPTSSDQPSPSGNTGWAKF